ncbi:YjdF family protein [Clostridium sp. MB40-C1]|uniref:YjdF family protein n=1 Tax=Clostridium sp. MB40-C1 TaxID=3070996 RepID=UPI0027E1C001|nr:YjdF family protein [Clostridium sp. MB40-C1]WMJ81780.1 YjdF family protein [Clostridium sp. MB40-C1]
MYTSVKLTVFFEKPFWVGVFERYEDDLLSVCKVVFGSEPKDCEVYEFLLKEFSNLKFSNPILNEESKKIKLNPKRLQKNIKKETKNKEVGTKSQLAMKLQQETNKIERRKKLKEQKYQEKEKQFQLKQQKKKQKHRGH